METPQQQRAQRNSIRFTPVRYESAADKTVDKLLTAIALGEFTEGDRLPTERDLAEQLQVARATVREAIRRLSATGVLDVRRGRVGGAYIRAPFQPEVLAAARRSLDADWPRLKTLLDLRSLVEGLVASTAAERHTEFDREEISAALEAHAAAATPQQVRDRDRDFHVSIAAAAGNPYLHELRTDLAAKVGLHFGSEPFVGNLERFDRARRQHHELAEAIFARDTKLASEIARQHFEMNVEAIESVRTSSEAE